VIIFSSNIPNSFAVPVDIIYGGPNDPIDDFTPLVDFNSGTGGLDWLFFGTGGNLVNFPIPLPETGDLDVFFDHGNSDVKSEVVESFVTCIDDIRRFYDGKFGVGVATEIFLFLDINEVGGPMMMPGLLDFLKIEVRSFDSITVGATGNADDPCSNDPVLTADQDALGDPALLTISGETVLAILNPAPIALPEVGAGGGKADWIIGTNVNAFDNALDDKNIMITIHMPDVSNGFEEIFLSGALYPMDFTPVGGKLLPLDQTALLLAGVQSVSMWMIPVVVAGIGIGVFVIKRKK